MPEIGRSYDILDRKIKELGADIRAADGDVRKLDKSLKLNPGNVDVVRQKYSALSSSLQLNTQRLTLLKQKQDALTQEFKDGNISQKEYERLLVKTRRAIEQAQGKVEQLTNSLREQHAAIREAKFTNLTNGLDKAEQKTSKLSKAAMVLVGALAAVFTQAMNTGAELDDNAKKYDTTAEKLQVMGNRYSYITGNADGYYQSLSKIGSMQSSIASGRGARYLNYLKQLGLTQDDIAHKTNAEVYETIEAALAKVTDSTERATIAQGLFGEVGLNVATVAGASADEVRKWDEVLLQSGIITNEQAATAASAADRWDALKLKFQSTGMELMVNLMPAFEALTGLLKTAVIPIINGLSQWLGSLGAGGQRILLVVLMLIIVLPKIIKLIKMGVTVFKTLKAATMAQAAATSALTAASTPWLGIITAISMALMLVVTLVSMFIGKANTAVDTSNELLASLGETEDKLNDMGYNLDYSAEQTYNSNTKRELDVNVKVDASGDGTEVNENNAQLIAGYIYDQMSIDLINQSLGAGVR